jgi:hypothetical protein
MWTHYLAFVSTYKICEEREEHCFGKLHRAYVILVVETSLIWGSLLCGIWYILAVLQGKGVGLVSWGEVGSDRVALFSCERWTSKSNMRDETFPWYRRN